MEITLETYLTLSKNYSLIPLSIEVLGDYFTPVTIFQLIREFSPYAYLLESVQQEEKLGRYSLIGFDPLMVIRSYGKKIEIQHNSEKIETKEGDPFKILFEILERYNLPTLEGLENYQGGIVGYFGYDTIRHVEHIPQSNPDTLKLPDSIFIIPRVIFMFDNFEQTLKIIYFTPSGDKQQYLAAQEKLNFYLDLLETPSKSFRVKLKKRHHSSSLNFKSNMNKEEYYNMIERAKKYIYDGDIFQVVLSQRFSMDYDQDPFEIYRSLRRINPSPYLYYLQYPDFQIAGSSPEILVKKEYQQLTVHPIAGTRKRGETPEEDKKLEKELLQDPKEIAEHRMLVDLARNDLGRISKFGSVQITRYLSIENYSHVKHIVSCVESTMRDDLNSSSLLPAVFPAGTLSGAPKVRAMEIIEELEVVKRAFYGGTVVNLDFQGNHIDACIAIRSVVIKDQKATIQAGGGIVANSNPEDEYQESLNKAKAVMKAIQENMEAT